MRGVRPNMNRSTPSTFFSRNRHYGLHHSAQSPLSSLPTSEVRRQVTHLVQNHPTIFSVTDALLQAATFNLQPSLTIQPIVDKARVCLTDDNDVDIPRMKHILRSAFVSHDQYQDNDSNRVYAKLMHAALFSSPSQLWLHGLETSALFPSSDRTGRRAWRFKVWQPGAPQFDNYITAFHGSPAGNWLSIMQSGMRFESIDFSSNGRAYGDGIYLAKSFRTAASFAPFEKIALKQHTNISSLCVVGEFQVDASYTDSGAQSRESSNQWSVGTPDEYLIVTNPMNDMRLVALHILATELSSGNRHNADHVAVQENTDRNEDDDRNALSTLFGRLYRFVGDNIPLIAVLLYVLFLTQL